MANPFEHLYRRWARLALLLLVVVPFLPEIAILTVAAFAKLMGCQPGQENPCLGSPTVSNLIELALQLSAGFIVTHANISQQWFVGLSIAFAAWIVACQAALVFGWQRVSSRLLLGFAVALVFAFLPFLGPGLALLELVEPNSCRPISGGIGPCKIFGSEVSGAHAAVGIREPDFQFTGALLAVGLFAVFAVGVIGANLVSAKARGQAS